MNFKAAFKYQLYDYKKTIIIYYLVVVLIYTFFGVTIAIGTPSNFSSTGGIEMTSMIFLFVVGLNSFKENFLMLLQNGISRKTMFQSKMGAAGVLCTGMMIIDRLIVFITSRLTEGNDRFYVKGMYEVIYTTRINEINVFQRSIEGILFTLCIYLIAISLGFLITSAYYRMNKAVKIAVSVGLPVSFIFVLPLIDTTIANGAITKAIIRLGEIFGLYDSHPYRFLYASLLGICGLMIIGWLLIKRAVDKK